MRACLMTRRAHTHTFANKHAYHTHAHSHTCTHTVCLRRQVPDESLKDLVLVRFFILEQVSFIYHFAMKKRFEEMEGLPPEKVNVFAWVFAWMVFWGSIWFFIYWTFAWGLTNSGETVAEWGRDYGVAIVQDIMVMECFKMAIMFCFAPMNARPQLQVIRRVINEAALNFVQEGAPDSRDVRIVQVCLRRAWRTAVM